MRPLNGQRPAHAASHRGPQRHDRAHQTGPDRRPQRSRRDPDQRTRAKRELLRDDCPAGVAPDHDQNASGFKDQSGRASYVGGDQERSIESCRERMTPLRLHREAAPRRHHRQAERARPKPGMAVAR
jgi:hypothetical protein